MGLVELFIIAVGLSMDAFAVSVCKGLSVRELKPRHALAVGATFAFLQVNILPAVCFIGATTFVLSCSGIKIGHVFGLKYKSRAEFFGGAVLILMGIKILLEHLGILG